MRAPAVDDTPNTLSGDAYRRLRADLIGGRLVPGSRLRIERLKADYGIGGSPLREALSRLASEGLVVAEGQRGFFAAELSLDDLDDVTRMRILLETEAVAQSVARGDDAWEANLVAAHHQVAKIAHQSDVPFDEWEQRNRGFHDAIVAACASRWLLHFRRAIYDQHERYRRISISDPTISRDVVEEHRAIFEAALARDIPRASELSALHIARTGDLVREMLSRHDAPAGANGARATRKTA